MLPDGRLDDGLPLLEWRSGRAGELMCTVRARARFGGRPSPDQLWVDLGEIHARTKPDFDATLPEPRAAWEAERAAARV